MNNGIIIIANGKRYNLQNASMDTSVAQTSIDVKRGTDSFYFAPSSHATRFTFTITGTDLVLSNEVADTEQLEEEVKRLREMVKSLSNK